LQREQLTQAYQVLPDSGEFCDMCCLSTFYTWLCGYFDTNWPDVIAVFQYKLSLKFSKNYRLLNLRWQLTGNYFLISKDGAP
jgi:hypothetical protein